MVSHAQPRSGSCKHLCGLRLAHLGYRNPYILSPPLWLLVPSPCLPRILEQVANLSTLPFFQTPHTQGKLKAILHTAVVPAILHLTSLQSLQARFRSMEGVEAVETVAVASSPGPSDPEAAVNLANREKGEHGCTHYRRRCRLVTPCCGEVFWCRHCHNEAKSQNETVCCRNQLK